MKLVVKNRKDYITAYRELLDIIPLGQMGSNGVPVFTYQLDPVKKSIDIQLHDQNFIMSVADITKLSHWAQKYSI